jgi:hypothetical protein
VGVTGFVVEVVLPCVVTGPDPVVVVTGCVVVVGLAVVGVVVDGIVTVGGVFVVVVGFGLPAPSTGAGMEATVGAFHAIAAAAPAPAKPATNFRRDRPIDDGSTGCEPFVGGPGSETSSGTAVMVRSR